MNSTQQISVYDYDNQCWIVNKVVQPCNHSGNCTMCYGTRHKGEVVNDALWDMLVKEQHG